MEALEEKAKAAYKRNVDSYGFVSAEIIKNAVTGKSDVKETLLSLFDEHNGNTPNVWALTGQGIPTSVILPPASIYLTFEIQV